MTFEFAKFTEITDFAFKHNPDYQANGYIRVFICPDVNDIWLVRILEGYNQHYDKQEGSFLLERDKIEKDYKGQELTLSWVREIIENDDFSNWDFIQRDDLDELISILDGGFGIHNLQ